MESIETEWMLLQIPCEFKARKERAEIILAATNPTSSLRISASRKKESRVPMTDEDAIDFASGGNKREILKIQSDDSTIYATTLGEQKNGFCTVRSQTLITITTEGLKYDESVEQAKHLLTHLTIR